MKNKEFLLRYLQIVQCDVWTLDTKKQYRVYNEKISLIYK